MEKCSTFQKSPLQEIQASTPFVTEGGRDTRRDLLLGILSSQQTPTAGRNQTGSRKRGWVTRTRPDFFLESSGSIFSPWLSEVSCWVDSAVRDHVEARRAPVTRRSGSLFGRKCKYLHFLSSTERRGNWEALYFFPLSSLFLILPPFFIYFLFFPFKMFFSSFFHFLFFLNF